MNLDDETLLTAYLDGELEASQRQQVEAALSACPRLDQRLRDLARVRELIGGLSRPNVPADLAPAVILGIQQAETARRNRRESRRLLRRRALILAPISAVAATLLLAWSLHGLSGHRDRIPQPKLVQRTPEVEPVDPAPTADPAARVAQVEPPSPGPEADAIAKEPGIVATQPKPPAQLVATAEPDLKREAARQADQERLRRMLGSMDVQRFLVQVDALDAANLQRIEDAITTTPRSNARHARFHVLQGLALDPEHPGEAVVFAMVLDEFELRNFRENLRRELPKAHLVANPVRPALIAQLTETEAVEIVEGQPSGSLVEHGRERPGPLAIRSNTPSDSGQIADMPPFPDPGAIKSGQDHLVEHRPRASKSERQDSRRPSESSDEPVRPDPRQPSHQPAVYLVWVEKRGETPLGRRPGS